MEAQVSPQFIYGANTTTHMIYGFQLNTSTGALTTVPGSPFNERLAPSAMAVNPAGTLLFVVNGADNDVSVFQIDTSTGALTEVANSPFSTGLAQNPTALIVDPSGKFLYVANAGIPTGTGPPAGEIDSYTIDATTGQLTPTPLSTPPNQGASAPISPLGMYVHPMGNWLYVEAGTALYGDINTIQGYLIARSTGDLNGSGIPIPVFSNLEHATAFAGDPAGQFLLNIWGGSVSCADIDTIAINQATGALSDLGSWSSVIYAQKMGGGNNCTPFISSGTVDATSTYFFSTNGSFLDTTYPVTPLEVNIPPTVVQGQWLADPLGPSSLPST